MRKLITAAAAIAAVFAFATPQIVGAADHYDQTWVQAMNQTSYWSPWNCTKYENHGGWIPAQYDAAVIKAGTKVRVYPDLTSTGAFQASAPDGKDISWVMKCKHPTTTTTTTTLAPTTTSPATTTTTIDSTTSTTTTSPATTTVPPTSLATTTTVVESTSTSSPPTSSTSTTSSVPAGTTTTSSPPDGTTTTVAPSSTATSVPESSTTKAPSSSHPSTTIQPTLPPTGPGDFVLWLSALGAVCIVAGVWLVRRAS